MLEIAFREWAICFCFLKRSRSLLGISDDGNKYNVLFNWPPSPLEMLNVGQKFILDMTCCGMICHIHKDS